MPSGKDRKQVTNDSRDSGLSKQKDMGLLAEKKPTENSPLKSVLPQNPHAASRTYILYIKISSIFSSDPPQISSPVHQMGTPSSEEMLLAGTQRESGVSGPNETLKRWHALG